MLPVLKVFIAGLCTILNPRNELSTLPEPSVICVRTGPGFGQTLQHTPFVAWDDDKVSVVATSGAITPLPVGTANFKYFQPDGERIEIERDPAGQGPPQTNHFSGIASYFQFSRYPASMEWDSCYIPPKMQNPSNACVAAFMRFGGGRLVGAAPTPFKVIFRDAGGATTVEAAYDREVVYMTAPPDIDGDKPSVTLGFHRLAPDDPIVREVKFTAKQPNADIEVFFGNEMETRIKYVVTQWMPEPSDLPSNPAALHFSALHMEVNGDPNARPIPYRMPMPKKSNKTDKKGGPKGGDVGYCGPDGIP
jgi:hypothetical protein